MKKNVSHFVQNSLRWLGISASLLCAVHCAAMPIMFMVVATHQVQHQHSNPWLEAGVLLFSFLVAVPIVYNNYRQHKHRYTKLTQTLTFAVCFLLHSVPKPAGFWWSNAPQADAV